MKRRAELAEELLRESRRWVAVSLSSLLVGGSFWAHFALGPVFFTGPVFVSWFLLHSLVFLAAFQPRRERILFVAALAGLNLYLASLLRLFEAPLVPAAPLFFLVTALSLTRGFRRSTAGISAWVLAWSSVLGWLTWRQDLSFALSAPWIFSIVMSGVFLAGVQYGFRRFALRLHTQLRAMGPKSEFEPYRLQAAKLQGLGELTASLAHEIATPLTSILGFAHQAKEAHKTPSEVPPDTLEQCLDRILANTRRVVQISRALRNYSRLESNQHQPLSLAEVVDDAVSLVAPSYKARGVDLQWNKAGMDELWVSGDFVSLSQVVVNLLTNARDAAELSGTPRVEVSIVADGPLARLSVQDSGSGVPTELKDRIFEPFFTTKPLGQGTGLGLSLVKRVVGVHNGQLRVQGSLFVVELARLSSKSQAA